MDVPQLVVEFLQERNSVLSTAESCTGGRIAALLTEASGCGSCLDCGYVVYSPSAKARELEVSQLTMDTFGLTSEEVVVEMAKGALMNSVANVAVATTGVTGDDAMDGVPPGTVWFAWAFQDNGNTQIVTRKERFFGSRKEVQLNSALYALKGILRWHP
ncbi:PncC family amidohydrolase [Pseudomonas sp. BIGb0408]|uniref:PncC family amidohydrolase n=1 Tax=Phytopseudomonas flavescens TaxID=29435 RepID=A0A7Y9XKG6_9GAMM|nr:MULTISPECIES: CinA family protein [Pseudomonas]MCW2292411.1 PncC family amidohydrolase [Pseudomonas sp. BIGb0408]NYH73018.1 PncC family amidohydrolase [Pseudomonas flavescens]